MNKNKLLTTIIAVCGIILLAAVALGFLGVNTYNYDNAEKYTAGETEIPETIRNLDIDWINGKVSVVSHDADTLTLRETSGSAISEDLQLRWWLDGDTLRVRFAKSGYRHGSFFGLFPGQEKELILTLPAGLELSKVNIDTASAIQDLSSLRTEKLDVDSASGAIKVQAEHIGEINADTASGNMNILVVDADTIDLDTASGSISITADRIGKLEADSASGAVHTEIGDLNEGKIHSASGSVSVKADRFNTLDVSTASGGVTALLPTEPGFTASLQTASGSMNYSLDLQKSGNEYICGDGSAKVRISTASGSIRLDPAK